MPTADATVATGGGVDVCILGAGASGLLCARTAAARGRRVCLVDHAAHAGRKVALSGGGKANFTNIHMGPEHFICDDPTFCEPALEAFTPRHILDILTRHRLAWEEREHGQLFGAQTAKLLVRALVDDCTRAGCRFILGQEPTSIHKTGDTFTITLPQGQVRARSLVLATGSPAWPQCGATDRGAQWARQMGHKPLSFAAALTPFTMPADWPLQGLAGISVPVVIRTGTYTRQDPLLFTHDGISGPAALQASCRWQPHSSVIIDFMPHMPFGDLLDARECGKLFARTLLARHIPQRLVDALLPPELARRKIAELSRAARTALSEAVHGHSVVPVGTAGLRRAEAATGGVPTHEVNAWSMESLRCPGLYITGELLNVVGHLGGYNLHWAWASGSLAGQYA